VGTYSGAWVSRYIQQSYIRIDPVVLGGFQRFHPVDWKDLDWSSKAARAFQADALEHGVGRQGLSIPIRGPKGQYALFTISHNASDEAWAGFIETARRDLILIAHYFNKKILDIEAEGVVDPSPVLSPRENETLTFLALGYSRAQVAHTLCISENTLRVYIESARYKLGAANTTHAVSLAVSRGLILL
jgi:DNA-binding CsgD family transcriptional regulator